MSKIKGERPQNKNLKPLTERPPEEAQAIRSKGGIVKAEKQRQKKALAEMLQMIDDLPITDKRVLNRLKKAGVDEDLLMRKMLIADALHKQCEKGNTYAISLYMELTGEGSGLQKENNLIDALLEATRGGMDTSDIPEVQQTSNLGNDLVESTGV